MVTNDINDVVRNLIEQEINAVLMTPNRVKENGRVACHTLFTLVERMRISEAEASDRREILFHDQNLNEIFIDHMKQRMMGVSFSLKSRDSKNRYRDSQMKDELYDLDVDLVNFGKDIVMWKLLITYLSLLLAQPVGVDHHAAKEELYYYMRTKDLETHTMLTEFMDRFYQKVCKDKDEVDPNL